MTKPSLNIFGLCSHLLPAFIFWDIGRPSIRDERFLLFEIARFCRFVTSACYQLHVEFRTTHSLWDKEQLVDWLGCLGSVPSLFVSSVAILCNFPIRSSLFNLANWKTIINIILVGGFKHEFYFPYGMSSFPLTNSYFSKWLLHHQPEYIILNHH